MAATTPLRIWVTRAKPGAVETAQRLRARGHDAVVQPLIKVRHLAPALDLAGVDALAFTSRNGVEAFARLSPDRRLPAFAVGEATARAATAAGFRKVLASDGDVEVLATQIAHSRYAAGTILSPGAAEQAADLEALLGERGVDGRHLAVYETVAAHPVTIPPGVEVVLIHSAKAARILAERLARSTALTEAIVIGISEAALAPLQSAPVWEMRPAPFPKEPAMLKLLPT